MARTKPRNRKKNTNKNVNSTLQKRGRSGNPSANVNSRRDGDRRRDERRREEREEEEYDRRERYYHQREAAHHRDNRRPFPTFEDWVDNPGIPSAEVPVHDVKENSLNLKNFEKYTDPKESDIRRLQYEACLANPSKETMSGVYVSGSGFTDNSVKLFLRATSTVRASKATGPSTPGQILIAYLNSSSTQVSTDGRQDITFGSGPNEGDYTPAYINNRMPKLVDLGGTGSLAYHSAATSSVAVNSGDLVVPGYGEAVSVLPGASATYWPFSSLGVDLKGARGRIVGQEFTVTCSDNALNKQGYAFSWTTANPYDADIEGKTIDELFGTQGLQLASGTLAELDNNHIFRSLRVPLDQADTNWCPMDWSNSPRPDQESSNDLSSVPWGGFCAYGCADDEVFTVVMHSVIEVMANEYSFATPNGAGGNSIESLQTLRKATPSSIVHKDDIPAHAAAAIAASSSAAMGKRHAAGFLDFVGEVPGKLGDLASTGAKALETGSSIVEGVETAGDVIGEILGALSIFGLAQVSPITDDGTGADTIAYHKLSGVADMVFSAPVPTPAQVAKFPEFQPPDAQAAYKRIMTAAACALKDETTTKRI